MIRKVKDNKDNLTTTWVQQNKGCFIDTLHTCSYN